MAIHIKNTFGPPYWTYSMIRNIHLKFLYCRSRDRFVESSQQIEALVQRFARETPLPDVPMNPMGSGKVPLSYGKPSEIKVWGMLYL